jgi:dCMP deaminase
MLTIRRRGDALSLEDFVDEHDLLLNGPPRSSSSQHIETDYKKVHNVATLQICNGHSTKDGLYTYLDGLDLLNEERLRPGWDTYFMVSPAYTVQP